MHMGYTFATAVRSAELVSTHAQHGKRYWKPQVIEILGDSLGAIWYTDDIAFGTGLLVHPEF